MNRAGLQDEGFDWAGITSKYTVTALAACSLFNVSPVALHKAGGLDGAIMEWE